MITTLVQKQSDSELTHENAALIMLAHQTDILLETERELLAEIRANFLALANTGRRFYLPTVLTTSDRAQYSYKLMQEIAEICPNIKIVNRPSLINAWQEPHFKTAVKNTNRSKLILAGVMTDICLAFTAISAAKEGYEVYVIDDAFGNLNNTVAQATLDRVMARMTEAGCKMIKRVAAIAQMQQAVKKNWEKKRAAEIA